MFESMRKVFGPLAVGIIIGAIALVFVFYGVYNPRTTKGMGAGAVAATVDGETISMGEYSREYNQRLEMYQNMMKGKMDPRILKQMGLRQQVMEDLVRRKLMLKEADKMGLVVSDDEIRSKIVEMPYFKKDGNFDRNTYEQVLAANKYAPATFEEMVKQDLLRGHFSDFLKERVKVSPKELDDEFMASEDRRQVDYVVVSRDNAKKMIPVGDKEIDELLKSEAGKNAVQMYYEQHKYSYMKPAPKKDPKKAQPKAANAQDAKADSEEFKPEFFPLEEVSRKVALEVLRDRRGEEVTKITREVANEILEKAKSTPSLLAGIAKAKGLELKTSEKFNRLQPSIAGIENQGILTDAFAANSPLLKGAKLYETQTGAWVVVANLKSFAPDLKKAPAEREKLMSQILARKERALFEDWMTEARGRTKIHVNQALMASEEETEN